MKSLLAWTMREIIFFLIYSTLITVLYEIINIKWLQVPLAPVGLIVAAVAFMVGFQNNAAYDRIWEARKIWGGIVNASRSLIINVRESFYLHRSESNSDEKQTLTVITNRHIAWLTALRYAMRTKKSWEADYNPIHNKTKLEYNI